MSQPSEHPIANRPAVPAPADLGYLTSRLDTSLARAVQITDVLGNFAQSMIPSFSVIQAQLRDLSESSGRNAAPARAADIVGPVLQRIDELWDSLLFVPPNASESEGPDRIDALNRRFDEMAETLRDLRTTGMERAGKAPTQGIDILASKLDVAIEKMRQSEERTRHVSKMVSPEAVLTSIVERLSKIETAFGRSLQATKVIDRVNENVDALLARFERLEAALQAGGTVMPLVNATEAAAKAVGQIDTISQNLGQATAQVQGLAAGIGAALGQTETSSQSLAETAAGLRQLAANLADECTGLAPISAQVRRMDTLLNEAAGHGPSLDASVGALAALSKVLADQASGIASLEATGTRLVQTVEKIEAHQDALTPVIAAGARLIEASDRAMALEPTLREAVDALAIADRALIDHAAALSPLTMLGPQLTETSNRMAQMTPTIGLALQSLDLTTKRISSQSEALTPIVAAGARLADAAERAAGAEPALRDIADRLSATHDAAAGHVAALVPIVAASARIGEHAGQLSLTAPAIAEAVKALEVSADFVGGQARALSPVIAAGTHLAAAADRSAAIDASLREVVDQLQQAGRMTQAQVAALQPITLASTQMAETAIRLTETAPALVVQVDALEAVNRKLAAGTQALAPMIMAGERLAATADQSAATAPVLRAAAEHLSGANRVLVEQVNRLAPLAATSERAGEQMGAAMGQFATLSQGILTALRNTSDAAQASIVLRDTLTPMLSAMREQIIQLLARPMVNPVAPPVDLAPLAGLMEAQARTLEENLTSRLASVVDAVVEQTERQAGLGSVVAATLDAGRASFDATQASFAATLGELDTLAATLARTAQDHDVANGREKVIANLAPLTERLDTLDKKLTELARPREVSPETEQADLSELQRLVSGLRLILRHLGANSETLGAINGQLAEQAKQPARQPIDDLLMQRLDRIETRTNVVAGTVGSIAAVIGDGWRSEGLDKIETGLRTVLDSLGKDAERFNTVVNGLAGSGDTHETLAARLETVVATLEGQSSGSVLALSDLVSNQAALGAAQVSLQPAIAGVRSLVSILGDESDALRRTLGTLTASTQIHAESVMAAGKLMERDQILRAEVKSTLDACTDGARRMVGDLTAEVGRFRDLIAATADLAVRGHLSQERLEGFVVDAGTAMTGLVRLCSDAGRDLAAASSGLGAESRGIEGITLAFQHALHTLDGELQTLHAATGHLAAHAVQTENRLGNEIGAMKEIGTTMTGAIGRLEQKIDEALSTRGNAASERASALRALSDRMRGSDLVPPAADRPSLNGLSPDGSLPKIGNSLAELDLQRHTAEIIELGTATKDGDRRPSVDPLDVAARFGRLTLRPQSENGVVR